MKKIFVSGATGFIGGRLCQRLAEEGNIIHALYRNEKKARKLNHPNIRLFKGDLMDRESLVNAISGCSEVYHVAAFAGVWVKDPEQIYRFNVEGSLNVIEAAISTGVRKMVITSTAGVLGSSGEGFINEESRPENHFTDYENSKAILEDKVHTINSNGLSIVLVNPSRVFGPGELSKSNSLTLMIQKYIHGKWHIIPGDGLSIGNYVFVEDVIAGHMLAMEKGKSGERYLIGGENLSYYEFFDKVQDVSGKKYRMMKIPFPLMLGLSKFLMFLAVNFGIKPAITPAHVRKFNLHFNLDISKAKNELGYQPHSFEEGLKKTISWINKNEK